MTVEMSDDPVQWTVFVIDPGSPERVAGHVTAASYEDAWAAAVAEFGDHVSAVTPQPTKETP